MSSHNLPQRLSDAVEALLAPQPGVLREEATRLREAYGRSASSSNVSVLAYLVSRLPATYAAISRVFELVADVDPGFAPRSMLDIGAGPGTASWAAAEFWPHLAQIAMVEHDGRFADVARDLAKASTQPGLVNAQIARSEMRSVVGKAELVVAAYVFAEQTEALSKELALKLWDSCEETLIIVEPGTPDGFRRVRSARDALLGAGAFMVAPCTHDTECPIKGTDWCHFKTRLQRSRRHMQAKGADVPFEDESFSFVAVSRHTVALPETRIIAPPISNKVGTTLKLCGHGGIEELHVASRNKPAYKLSKKRNWGDSWG